MTTTLTDPIAPGAATRAVGAPSGQRRPRPTAGSLAARYRRQSTRRGLRHTLLTIAAWSIVAGSVALFLADGGMRQFGTLGDAVTSLGIIAGLIATALMCLMLLLTARVPVIDQTLGQDRATSLHATIGRGMVFGLLAHGKLLLLGYSFSGKITPITTFAGLWADSTDFRWAVAATALLGVVGISSMVAVRRKYPYEVWFAIHLTTYAAIIASLPHQFSMSGLFAEGKLERTFWIALWLVTAGTMLAFRILLPILSTLTHRLTVTSVVPVGPDAVSIEVRGRKLDTLGATGGQWLNWRFLTPSLVLQPHPFSLSAAPTDTTMRITVRDLGAGTARLQHLKPGTKVAVEGPYGLFSDAARTREHVLLVGAGIGIAPIRALLEATDFAPGNAVVVLRASTPEELYFVDEVRDLCAHRGAALHLLVGPRAWDTWVSTSYAGARLSDFAPWVRDADVFVCGPNPWMDAVLADAEACGIPRSQVHDERFTW